MRGRHLLTFVVVALLALSGGYFVSNALSNRTATVPPAGAATALLDAVMPDLTGAPQKLAQWKGKVIVVNFWATWCEPCREEIPALIDVQRQWGGKGVQIVGIAVDQPDKVKPYAAQMRINYPVLVGELDALDLTRAAGNKIGGLPYTIVLDRTGKVAGSQLGGVTQSKLEEMFAPLL